MSFLAATLAASLLVLGAGGPERMVRVRVLERLHPREAVLQGPARYLLEARGAALHVDGTAVAQPFEVPDGSWRVQRSGAALRHYRGALSVRAVEGELALVLTLPLERYVAEVVASETTPGAAAQALQAQAVVVRSFVLAQGPRHAEADVCDLAHCQLLRGNGVSAEHRAAAEAAAEATRGRVLVLSSGAIAEALFHAACGGHTGSPEEVLGLTGTGAAAVPDSGCPARPWTAWVPTERFRAALQPLFLEAPSAFEKPEGLALPTLELVLGQGGYVTRVVLPAPHLSARGDSVARALDRALGWGAVRSGRFSFQAEGAGVRVSGSGLGHGLGLCQAGAALRAARGASYQAILQHYFPKAALR